jgi:hypothetical protein
MGIIKKFQNYVRCEDKVFGHPGCDIKRPELRRSATTTTNLHCTPSNLPNLRYRCRVTTTPPPIRCPTNNNAKSLSAQGRFNLANRRKPTFFLYLPRP